MPLHPILEAMLKEMQQREAPPTNELDPVQVRENYRAMRTNFSKVELFDVRDDTADGVPIRVYRPREDTSLPCLVYYHGGGWVIGDLDTGDSVCRLLADQAGCVVVATDYRLAPEHPWPAGLEDCYAVLEWVHANADALGVDAERLAVGGESAGGNLAACVALKAKAESGPALVHQLLVCAVTDTAFDTPSYRANGEGYLLSKSTMEWFLGHYVPAGQDRFDPMIAPLHTDDVSALPAATVITAEFDPLRDEGEAYASKLENGGIDVTYKCYDGMMHEFFAMSDLLDDARDAVALAARRLAAAFR